MSRRVEEVGFECPDAEEHGCCVARCGEERAWKSDDGDWFCEEHATQALRGERPGIASARAEELAGRVDAWREAFPRRSA